MFWILRCHAPLPRRFDQVSFGNLDARKEKHGKMAFFCSRWITASLTAPRGAAHFTPEPILDTCSDICDFCVADNARQSPTQRLLAGRKLPVTRRAVCIPDRSVAMIAICSAALRQVIGRTRRPSRFRQQLTSPIGRNSDLHDVNTRQRQNICRPPPRKNLAWCHRRIAAFGQNDHSPVTPSPHSSDATPIISPHTSQLSPLFRPGFDLSNAAAGCTFVLEDSAYPSCHNRLKRQTVGESTHRYFGP